jgi:hypothetical protein
MQAIHGHLTLSPSDLNDYVECAHLTTLALEVARGERARPHVADEHAELLRRKGEEHERAHLERLRAEGRAVVEIELGEPWDFEAAAARTVQAMREGAEVIAQAAIAAAAAPPGFFLERVLTGEKNARPCATPRSAQGLRRRQPEGVTGSGRQPVHAGMGPGSRCV